MLALELVKDLFERFSHNITKDVHATTMGHTNDDFANTRFDEGIEGNLEAGNE
jgi:hypothetical protein